MAANSSIEWTDSTWNPTVGCTIVSPGCTNCYAMKMAWRLKAVAIHAEIYNHDPGPTAHYLGTVKDSNGGPVWTGKVVAAPEHILTMPLRWKKPRRIFVNSMSDLFHEAVPDSVIDRVFAVMALCPQHTFQVLTKRADRMREYMRRLSFGACGEDAAWAPRRLDAHACELSGSPCAAGYMEDVPWPLTNVWLGVSCERQQEADERIPQLLQTPAAVRFVSCEPLLGPIDLRRVNGSIDALEGSATFPALDWVITGGESGPHARPMHPEWPGDIRDHCQAAGVAFFHKQNGEFASVSEVEGEGAHHHFSDGATVRRVGKTKAGRLLRGQEWNQYPKTQQTQPASAPVLSHINPATQV